MSDVEARLNAALEGRYRVERGLGEGGMATVYLAADLKHERKVALKVLKPELAAVVGAERFLAEIKTTANLQHPHILPLFDSGEADGFLFYVMPYVEGESLRDRINREHQLPVDDAVRIATNVAEALDYAHRKRVIHRDIKPANILLQDGKPVISDFGIALAVGVAGGGRLTETGLSVGTPHYMSPEQATGDQTVGAATDIYALGAVLYEMLVGDPPYVGSTAQAILGKIIAGKLASATEERASVPANVDAAIRKALEKLPADRFTGAQEFAGVLADPGFRHGVVDEAAVAAGDVGPWKRVSVATTGLAIVLTLALGWSLLHSEAPEPVEYFESPFRDGQQPIFFGNSSFSLSQDGSMLVYRGPSGAARDQLWVRRWDDPDASPVRGTESARYPTVSPDGRWLAFDQDGLVKVLSFEGGPAVELTRGIFPRWGPDEFVYATAIDLGIVRVPAAGGAPPDTVTRQTDGDGLHQITDFLPGGEGALLQVNLDVGREIRSLNLGTGEMSPLAFGTKPRYARSGHLVYLTPEGTLMAARFDPRSMELLGPAVAILEGVGAYTLSETGKLFYAAGGVTEELDELVWMTRSGEATPLQVFFNRGSFTGWGWSISPDGTRIALRSTDTEGNADIWVKRLPDGPMERLTVAESEDSHPWWGPDNETVTYVSGASGDRSVWSMRVDGTGEPQLVLDEERNFGLGVWSPNGEWLVLTAQYPGGSADIVGLRSGVDNVPSPLVASEFDELNPGLSPNGRWLAYTSNRTGRYEVYVRPFPNVDSTRVQVSTEGANMPVWAHSGNELFFIDDNRGLVAVRVETASGFTPLGQETLFTIPPGFFVNPVGPRLYDIAPDDQRFLMGRRVRAGEDAPVTMILVNNFFDVLKERVPN